MDPTPSYMFDSTISKVNKSLLLLIALSTSISLTNRLFLLSYPGLDLRSLGGGSGVKVRLRLVCLKEFILACPS